MQSKEADEVIRLLRRAISTIERVAEDCSQIEESTDLPKAFPVVAKWVPLVFKVLSSIRAHLKLRKAEQETQEDKDGYPELKQVAGECAGLAENLEKLFVAVTSTDTTPKIERYREAVGNGDRLEEVMTELISRVREVALVPLVSEDEVRELEQALAEVKQLPASLKEDAGGRNTFYNTSSGVQPIYLGKGNQNISTGSGAQITGNASNSRFIFQTRGEPEEEESKAGVRK
ncbi:hypothetical protein N431DRAFT_438363 [Stipitochalara longipes BDJ]|nr:hypothetical protein N431DRAFT_438363 [Stipitochalara longipes BDJ]